MLKEECGVFGIISKEPVLSVGFVSNALIALQHRGQEGAGICTFLKDSTLDCYKNLGLVSDIFDSSYFESRGKTKVALGHVRYSTTGANSIENTQPIATNHFLLNFALSHNGNITNAYELRKKIVDRGGVLYTTNDSEIISVLIVEELLKNNDINAAVFNVMDIIEGAFSLVVATNDKLIAVRDKNGFRPLCIGKLKDSMIFASESCALDSIGAEFVRDVEPGELVSISIDGSTTVLKKDVKNYTRGLCVFELVYFSRPDSVIDNISVYKARIEMGKALARQKPVEADLVCGVPDSGLEAAYGYCLESKIPYGSAFIKNKYVGRSFIVPTQLKREQTVNVKLNPLRASIEGKRIILVDDSIVRGTTSAKIIKALRNAGAKEIHMRISSPPFKYPCFFGTDIDSRENLIANKYSIEEIGELIGADSLDYLSLDNLLDITMGIDIKYCCGCFCGKYPIKVMETSKDKFEAGR